MAGRNRNETYNTTYNLKTQADFTSLINGFKEVQKTLSAKASQSDILGIEKSIERLQELQTKATNIANRGFTSNKDIKQYNSIMNALVTRADALNAKLSNLHFKNLDNELKNAKKDLKQVQTELNSIQRTTERSIATSLKGIKGNKEYAKQFIEAADNEQERLNIEQKITKEINDQIKVQKKSKKEAENSLPQYTALNDPYAMAASPYYGSRQKMERISYTDIKGNKLNDDQLAQIEKEYKRIVETSSSATQAIRNFKAKLEEMYIVIESRGKHIKKPSDTIKEAFSDSFKIKGKILDSDAIKDEITTISNNIDQLTSKREELKTLFASEEFVNSLNAIATAQENVTAETERLAQAEENAGNTELPEKIKQLNEELDRLDNEATDANLELEGFKQSQETINNFTNSLQNSVKQVLSITASWRIFRQLVSQTYNDVKELDKSFAQIAMVTNYEVSDLWGRYEEYAQLANRLGQSTQSVVEASGLYYQQGLDTVEVMELTEQTMKLATLAGLDFKEATAQMTAAIRGFHMEMSEGQRVTDVYAEVAAHAAVDVKGLSDAMSATASIANSAGMQFETTTAMLATMAEATQEAPKNLGTALKTVIARFTELKENVAGTADSEFDDLDYNKVDKALKTVGVQLKDTTGQFRNLDEVFLELGKKWNTLDRNSQRYIATIAAGSRQQSRFIALMENYERTMQLVDVAQNSAGKSQKQFAKFSDSVEYKVNKLKNTWEQFRINLVDSSAYGKVIDFATTIAEKFEDIDLSKLLALAPMILVLGRTMGKQWVTGFSKSITSEKGLINKAITKITKSKDGKTKVNIEADISDYKKILEEARLEKKKADLILSQPFKLKVSSQDIQKELSTAQQKLEELRASAQQNLKGGMVKNLTEDIQEAENKVVELEQKLRNVQQVEESQKNAKAASTAAQKIIDEAEAGLKESEKSLRHSSVVRAVGTAVGESVATAITMAVTDNFDWSEIFQTTAIESAISGVSTLLSGDIAAGISQIVVAGISWAGSAIADKIEEATEKSKVQEDKVYAIKKAIVSLTDIQEKYNENLDKANQKYDEQKEHWDKVNEAAKTYQDLKSRIALTTEQEEELQSAQKTLIDECPELVTRYDAAGQEIIDLGKHFDTVIEKQRQLYNEAALNQSKAELGAQLVNTTKANLELEKNKEEQKEFDKLQQQTYSRIFLRNPYQFVSGDPEKSLSQILKLSNWDKVWDEGLASWDERVADAEGWFEEALDNSTYLLELTNKILDTDYETVDELIDFINADNTEEKWDKVRKGLQEKIFNNEAITDLKTQEQELEVETKKSVDLFKNTISNYIQTQATADGLIDEDNPMASYLTDALSSYTINSSEISKEIDKIETELRKKLEKAVESNDADTIAAATEEAIQLANKKVSEAVENFKENSSIEDIINSFEKADVLVQETVKKFFDNLGKVTLKESYATIKEMENNGFDNEIIRYVKEKTGELQKETNEYKRQLAEAMGLSYGSSGTGAGYAYTPNQGPTFSSTNINQVIDQIAPQYQSAFVAAIMDAMGSATSDEEKSYFINRFNDFLGEVGEGIDPQAFAYFTSEQDWADLNLLNLEESQQKFFDYYQETLGHTLDEAKKAWELYFTFIKTNTNVIDLIVDKAALEERADAIGEELTEKVSKFSGIQDVIKSQLTDGFISFSQSQELKEACEKIGVKAEDYLQYGTDGTIIFNAEQFKNDTKDVINNEEKIIEKLKLQVAEEIEKSELQLAILNGDETEIGLLEQKAKSQANFNTELKKQLELLSAAGLIDSTKYKKIQNINTTYTSNYDSTSQSQAKTDLENYIKDLKEYQEELNDPNSELVKTLLNQSRAASKEIDSLYNNAVTDTEEATSSVEDVTEAYENWEKQVETVNEKIKALNETIYGTEYFDSGIDSMYNYTTALERVTKAADNAKDVLEDLQDTDNAGESMDKYLKAIHDEAAISEAEARVYAQAITNGQKVIDEKLSKEIERINKETGTNMSTDVSGLYKLVGDRYQFDIARINNLPMNDDIKKMIADELKSWNDNLDKIEELEKKRRDRIKEYQKLQKDALSNVVNLEEEMKNTLKEKYEQEIEDVENKYKAMEEADNEYVDALEEAIKKQRELRDRENQWNDLANKERKLSLMQRDTSGSNRVETRQLEKEVQDDRQQLLDNSVDDIIDGLKEMYELQKESREAEIEYRKALIDEGMLMREVTAALANINTADDLVAWFYENTANLSDMSEEQIKLEEMGWRDLFDAKTVYMETSQADFEDALLVTEADIAQVVNETSETLTTKADQTLSQIGDSVSEAIKKAQKDLEQARKDLQEKWEAYLNALEKTYSSAAKNALGGIAGGIVGGITSSTSTSSSSNSSSNNKTNNAAYNIVSKATQTATNATRNVLSSSNTYNPADHYKNRSLAGVTDAKGTINGGWYQNVSNIKPATWYEKTENFDAITMLRSLHRAYKNEHDELWEDNKGRWIWTNNGKWTEKGFEDLGVEIKHRYGFSGGSPFKVFAKGGLVDFTGPAWVDGTKRAPEAFLSAEDTKRIGEAAKLLATSPLFNNTSWEKNDITNNTVGDTVIDIHVNIENVSSDYDVDQAIERVKQDIVDAAKYTGSNVILNKRV